MRVNTPEANIIFKWIQLFRYKLMVVLFVNEFSTISKVCDKDLICSFAKTHKKVLRVNVIVDKVFLMNPLHSVNELISN